MKFESTEHDELVKIMLDNLAKACIHLRLGKLGATTTTDEGRFEVAIKFISNKPAKKKVAKKTSKK